MRTRKIFEAAYGESQHPPIFEARVKGWPDGDRLLVLPARCAGRAGGGDVVQVSVEHQGGRTHFVMAWSGEITDESIDDRS